MKIFCFKHGYIQYYICEPIIHNLLSEMQISSAFLKEMEGGSWQREGRGGNRGEKGHQSDMLHERMKNKKTIKK